MNKQEILDQDRSLMWKLQRDSKYKILHFLAIVFPLQLFVVLVERLDPSLEYIKTIDAYNKHLIQIERASKIQAEEVMNDAAARLHQKVSIERPDDNEEDGEDTIAHVSVTVKGIWQKRGHSCKIGVVFSVDTGEILGYEMKSLLSFMSSS